MNLRRLLLPALVLAFSAGVCHGAFHVMQIEEVIGGVNGNTSIQAIQLRMRSAGQNVLSSGRLRAWDATGANPILLLDMTTNVTNSASGSNVLLTSAAFNSLMSSVPGYATDFTLTSTIPVSYLSGGKITFESNAGLIYWAVAFGSYTGTNTGDTTNDSDGNFGAPTVALPTNLRRGVRFTGLATAPSTTNVADYALTADPATVRNNAGTTFTVVPEPGAVALLAAFGLGVFAIARRRG